MLFRKMLRDIIHNFTQFMTIFAMVAIAMAVYVGVKSYGDGLKVSADNLYEQQNMPDLWLMGSGFSEQDMKEIRSVDGVADAMRYLSLSMTGEVTYAVRDTVIDGIEIKNGDIMGIGDSSILAVSGSVDQTVKEMLKKMMGKQ